MLKRDQRYSTCPSWPAGRPIAARWVPRCRGHCLADCSAAWRLPLGPEEPCSAALHGAGCPAGYWKSDLLPGSCVVERAAVKAPVTCLYSPMYCSGTSVRTCNEAVVSWQRNTCLCMLFSHLDLRGVAGAAALTFEVLETPQC